MLRITHTIDQMTSIQSLLQINASICKLESEEGILLFIDASVGKKEHKILANKVDDTTTREKLKKTQQ